MSSFFQFSNISFIYEMFRSAYGGIEWFLFAYLVCLAGFFVVGRERLTIGFLYPFLFTILTIFNPFLIVPIAERIGLAVRFRRLFWLIPVNLVLAYVFTVLCSLRMKRWLRMLLIGFCAVFVITLGTSAVPYLRMPQNIYKTSNEILQISEILEADSTETGLEKRTLFSSQNLLELRQYDASIRGILRRSDLLDWSIDPENEEEIQAVIDSGHHLHRLTLVSRYGIQIDRDRFLKSIEKCSVNYIIAHSDMNLADYYISCGFTKIGQAGEFEIFRRNMNG